MVKFLASGIPDRGQRSRGQSIVLSQMDNTVGEAQCRGKLRVATMRQSYDFTSDAVLLGGER